MKILWKASALILFVPIILLMVLGLFHKPEFIPLPEPKENPNNPCIGWNWDANKPLYARDTIYRIDTIHHYQFRPEIPLKSNPDSIELTIEDIVEYEIGQYQDF